MAKKDQFAEIAAALEEITRSLAATNEILKTLAAQRTGQPALESVARPGAEHAMRASVEATSDETVLSALAAREGLTQPMNQLIRFRNANRPMSRPNYWAIVNFNLHSRNKRMFLFSVRDESVEKYLCAHGKGSEGASDDGMADVFSNEDGSNCSSLGIYLCAETYFGDNGYSLKLDGQEPTNFRARHRAIVIHGAPYVSQDIIDQTGRIGRSLGCPAVENRFAQEVIDALKEGSLLNVWKS